MNAENLRTITLASIENKYKKEIEEVFDMAMKAALEGKRSIINPPTNSELIIFFKSRGFTVETGRCCGEVSLNW